MSFLQRALENLPQAAQSPYAFLAYLGAIIAWFIIALQVRRIKLLLEKIQNFPDEQKREIILAEMGRPVPPNLSPKEWLRLRRQSYLFYGFVILCIAVVIIFVIAATTADTVSTYSFFLGAVVSSFSLLL
jgi:amino acid transporter